VTDSSPIRSSAPGASSFGPALMERLERLAQFSDDPGCLTRLYLSPSHALAAQQVGRWMEEAGMRWRIDAVGNVVGRYDGTGNRPALLLGSHIDTVRNAGRYDGTLGVLAAIAAVGDLAARGERLPFPVEVIAFGDEEGVRFPTTLIGSRAIAGQVRPSDVEARDQDGVSVREALAAFGGDADRIASCTRAPGEVAGYLELHIEQGPVLETEKRPLGIVTAISGATRLQVEVMGGAGHAGTVPMRLRRDALAAAAEMVLAVEREARGRTDLVATVGVIDVKSKAVNVIPCHSAFTLDVRSHDDAVRRDGGDRIRAAVRTFA
jgi:allantoate deiminase